MKKSYIVAGLMVVIAAVLLMSSSDELSTYSTFSEAQQNESKVKVVGKLLKDKPMVYNPEENPNYFSFFIEDADGKAHQVVYNDAKPQDFELSEQVVVTGKMDGDTFMASEMLLKCPSKYKEDEISIKTRES